MATSKDGSGKGNEYARMIKNADLIGKGTKDAQEERLKRVVKSKEETAKDIIKQGPKNKE